MLTNGHKKRIKKVLSHEWQSTTKIVRASKVHYYKTMQILENFLSEGIVELDRKSDRFSYWRLKK